MLITFSIVLSRMEPKNVPAYADVTSWTVQLPSFLDWFGWCTWDAFYTDVTAEGVEEGIRR